MDRTGRLRNLGRLLVAAGMLAERDGRTDEAIRAYRDAIRLGFETGRGGLILDELTGLAIESTGLQGLLGLRSKLDSGPCRDLISALEDLDAGREPLATIIDRETAWFRRTSGWKTRMLFTFAPGTVAKMRRTADASAEAAYLRGEVRLRLLLADLAIRRFRLEHGKDPETLAELVPKILHTVPIDPFSGKPLIYRPRPEGYLLYSVGFDRVDDGGRHFPERTFHEKAKGDYLVDPLEAPDVTPAKGEGSARPQPER
jgi:hypothetical protein